MNDGFEQHFRGGVGDAGVNRKRLSDNLGGVVDYQFDALHRMTQQTLSLAGVQKADASFGYNDAIQIASLSRQASGDTRRADDRHRARLQRRRLA